MADCAVDIVVVLNCRIGEDHLGVGNPGDICYNACTVTVHSNGDSVRGDDDQVQAEVVAKEHKCCQDTECFGLTGVDVIPVSGDNAFAMPECFIGPYGPGTTALLGSINIGIAANENWLAALDSCDHGVQVVSRANSVPQWDFPWLRCCGQSFQEVIWEIRSKGDSQWYQVDW